MGLNLQEKLKSAITAATGYQPVAVSVSFDFADSKKTIETILEQDRNMCRFLWVGLKCLLAFFCDMLESFGCKVSRSACGDPSSSNSVHKDDYICRGSLFTLTFYC